MNERFLDTNIVLNYFTRSDEGKALEAFGLLKRLEAGEESVFTSPLVIFEIVFTLERKLEVSKEDVAEFVLPIVRLPGLRLSNKNVWVEAFHLYTTHPIGFADSYNAAYMDRLGLSEIYTWDEDFDKLQGIRRVSPSAPRSEKEAA